MNQTEMYTTLKGWLDTAMGTPDIFTITFSANFVSGNLINGSFNGDAFEQVAFTTNQATTMQLLAASMRKSEHLLSATVTDTDEITCVGFTNGVSVSVTGPTVTGGASQPTSSVSHIQTPIQVLSYAEDQASPRMNYPFATFKVLSVSPVAWDQYEPVDPVSGIQNIGGWRRVAVRFQYFGDNFMSEMLKAFQSLQKREVISYFSTRGMVINEKGSVQNLSEMLETKWDPRASFDVFFGIAENMSDKVGVIETVVMEGEFSGGGEIIDVGPITVTGD